MYILVCRSASSSEQTQSEGSKLLFLYLEAQQGTLGRKWDTTWHSLILLLPLHPLFPEVFLQPGAGCYSMMLNTRRQSRSRVNGQKCSLIKRSFFSPLYLHQLSSSGRFSAAPSHGYSFSSILDAVKKSRSAELEFTSTSRPVISHTIKNMNVFKKEIQA